MGMGSVGEARRGAGGEASGGGGEGAASHVSFLGD